MSVNTPEVQVLNDTASSVVVKVVGWFSGVTSTNTKIQANTFLGANTAAGRTPILSITNIKYTTSLTAGRLSVEFAGSTNARAVMIGRNADGELPGYIVNSAVAPSGDLTINTEAAGATDSFTLILTLAKEKDGIPGNVGGYGSGAWANAYSWT